MAELLLFNIQDPEKLTAIRLLSLRLGLKWRSVPPELQNLSIDELLNGADVGEIGSTADPFTDEVLLMHALPQEAFHTLLDTLRREGQSIRLKAVVTDHNRSWTAARLHRELCAEEEAMKKWKQHGAAKKHR